MQVFKEWDRLHTYTFFCTCTFEWVAYHPVHDTCQTKFHNVILHVHMVIYVQS